MLKFLLKLTKYLLVVINLKSRTIFARLHLYPIFKIQKTPKNNVTYNPTTPNFDISIVNEINLKTDVSFFNNSIKVLNDIFPLDFFLKNKDLNKEDYLHYYTFFYLNWRNLNVELKSNNNFLFNNIISSKLSFEPFVISQQAFNLILNGNNDKFQTYQNLQELYLIW
jgi:hypothetical protein